RSSESSAARADALPPPDPTHDVLRGDVHQEREDEEDQREVDERADLEAARRALVGRRDLRRERVAAREQVPVDEDAAADHLRDCDRLADGAAEPEDQGGRDAAARVREHDAAHHLPPRRAERERALLQLRRDAEEELATDARDDREDHDREHDDRREDARAARRRLAEERDPAEGAVQRRLDVVAQDRAEDEDAPEPDDDARDGRERLDERRDRAAQEARCQLREVERDADRERRRDEQGEQRRDHGAEEEAAGAVELVRCDRLPGDARDERDPVLVERRPRAVDHLPGDQEDEHGRGRRRDAGDDLQQQVAQADAPPLEGAAREVLRQISRAQVAGLIFAIVFSATTSTDFGIGWKSSRGPYVCPFVTAQKRNFLSSAAFVVCCGTTTYVYVEIGYASLNFLGGLTIESSFVVASGFWSLDAAARMPFSPGVANLPEVFFIAKYLRWFFSANATSAYPIEPGVCVTAPATPELPR